MENAKNQRPNIGYAFYKRTLFFLFIIIHLSKSEMMFIRTQNN